MHDLQLPQVQRMKVWVQFHKLPPIALSQEGILMLARELGTPVSKVKEGLVHNSKFYRIRIMMPVDRQLKDKLVLQHSIFGRVVVFLVYERLT